MAQMNTRGMSEPPLLRIEPFKGMNLSVTPTQIDNSQASEMLNLNVDERGSLNKRTGYERVYATSLGEGQINGMYHYRKPDGSDTILFAHKNTLYKTEGIPSLATNARPMRWEDYDLTKTWEELIDLG